MEVLQYQCFIWIVGTAFSDWITTTILLILHGWKNFITWPFNHWFGLRRGASYWTQIDNCLLNSDTPIFVSFKCVWGGSVFKFASPFDFRGWKRPGPSWRDLGNESSLLEPTLSYWTQMGSYASDLVPTNLLFIKYVKEHFLDWPEPPRNYQTCCSGNGLLIAEAPNPPSAPSLSCPPYLLEGITWHAGAPASYFAQDKGKFFIPMDQSDTQQTKVRFRKNAFKDVSLFYLIPRTSLIAA